MSIVTLEPRIKYDLVEVLFIPCVEKHVSM